MVTNLDDAVEITPKLIRLFKLIRDENSLEKSSQIVGISKGRFWRILKRDRDKYVREFQYQNAVNYFKRQGMDEKELCDLLEIENLEETFVFVRTSERESLVEKANGYIAGQEISRTEFFKQLREQSPEIADLHDSTFHDLFAGKPKVANLQILKALKIFLQDKSPVSAKESVDYDEVMEMADSYIESKGITKNGLAKELRKFNPSIGGLTTINDWFNRKQRPSDPEKLRIIKKYLQISKDKPKLCGHLRGKEPGFKTKKISLVPGKYIRGLYYVCFDGQSDPDFPFPDRESYPASYGHKLEGRIMESYKGQKRRKLPQQILLNLFADSLCPSVRDFQETFPRLYLYLTKNKKKAIEEVFGSALSSMPETILAQVADNFEIDVAYLNQLIQKRASMEYAVAKKNIGYKDQLNAVYRRKNNQIGMIKEDIIRQIMGKIS